MGSKTTQGYWLVWSRPSLLQQYFTLYCIITREEERKGTRKGGEQTASSKDYSLLMFCRTNSSQELFDIRFEAYSNSFPVFE